VGDNFPFDMVVRNRASRYHLVMDALNNGRRTPPEDLPEVRDWGLGDWAEQG
jgi:xylulose-5-phosphate/fructose-6-phosphate phosphoketolase